MLFICYRTLLALEHSSEVQLSTFKLLDGFPDTSLGHRESLNHRLDAMLSSKFQHLPVLRPRRDKRALDGDAVDNKGQIWDLEVTHVDGEWVDGRLGGHHGKDECPVGLSRGCDEEAIDGAVVGEVCAVFAEAVHGDEVMGAKTEGFVLLAFGAGDDDDFATELGGELNGEVTKTTNTHDRNSLIRGDTHEWCEDGGTSTLQRCGILITQCIGDGVQEGLAPDCLVAHASLVGVDASVKTAIRAEDIFTLEAASAETAAVRVVAPADSVALLEVPDIGTGPFDDAYTFVPENHILRFLQITSQ